MAKKILIGLVVIIGILVVVIATRPSSFHIERAADMNAPPAVVFAQVNDFHHWEAWSPWAKLDPAMKAEFSGAASGEGAMYSWTGNDQVGEGKMTIVESKAPDRVRIKLEFLKPYAAQNITAFDFKGDNGKSKVTWAMEGNNNFMMKAFSMFMNMDAMIGKDFEKGLAQLKAVSEAEAARQAAEAQAAQQPAQPTEQPAEATK